MKDFLKEQYQFIVSVVIFMTVLGFEVEFYKMIILLLEFIVILEVVKMIGDFIEKNKLSLRFIIDVFIVFLIRDIVILVTDPKTQNEKILFLIFIIFIFFIFRYFAVRFSPLRYKKRKVF